ncbi:YegP family protein [Vibrio mimicus]
MFVQAAMVPTSIKIALSYLSESNTDSKILRSAPYTSKQNALNGINSVKENANSKTVDLT